MRNLTRFLTLKTFLQGRMAGDGEITGVRQKILTQKNNVFYVGTKIMSKYHLTTAETKRIKNIFTKPAPLHQNVFANFFAFPQKHRTGILYDCFELF